jgi:hypothetical protein
LSHLKERKETNCLNCNAAVDGKFCSVCGQENIEPAESAWHLITHFFNDITHFDGKFFSSLKYLVLKPGFLSSEYKLGRRASYLNPVRMYVFTSFIFFLVFFSVYHLDHFDGVVINGKTTEQIQSMDSSELNSLLREIGDSTIRSKEDALKELTKVKKKGFSISSYRDKKEYDSLLATGAKQDGWVVRKVNYRLLELKDKYNNDNNKMQQALMASFTHSFPQMLFVSLPLFALILKLLYIRRKHFYYVSHAIFSIHFYVFLFIMLLAVIGILALKDSQHWNWLSWAIGFLCAWMYYYEYRAMRNFYGQSRGKTIFKFILLNIGLFFLVTLIFIGFMIFSFLKV